MYGGKDGRDNCTRVYSGTGEVLGIDDGKEGGGRIFFTSSEVWKKTPKVFHSHCQKKKTTNLEVNSTNSCI